MRNQHSRGGRTAPGGGSNHLAVVSPNRAEAGAGRANLVFPVLLTRPSPTGVTARVNAADDTARAGSDHVAVRRGRLTIRAGATRGTIVVGVVGDRAPEPHERFRVQLSGAIGAGIADGTGVGTILNDD